MSRLQNKGFTLVEVIVSSALLLILSTAFFGGIVLADQARTSASLREHADMLAQEGIEAARSIRDSGFSKLVNGTYGLEQSGGTWIFSSSSDITGQFTRSVTVATVDTATKKITSAVSWTGTGSQTASTSMLTYLTNTSLLYKQANALQVTTSGASIGGAGQNMLDGITIQNTGLSTTTVAYITVSWTSGTIKIQQMIINGTTVWSSTGPGTPTGTQSSGTLINIQDVSLAPGSGVIPINSFTFSGVIPLNTFTITFTMGDGSTKTATTGAL